ncbi:stalk domain-containing protein [Chengkuizengella axinellae]|uniref:CAP domain-containing protein n=1 Tax=Chengkuizengella axinellae TaxID=3064388 RepID=A0ABT9IXN6_9BACL|nr:CAP domain-containing protein [Chengkuizengella sp. 2205SS18-9]MDP5274131.1 CAP domain-containing protein [Chengkuizengella sp. 2205SS18-9]
MIKPLKILLIILLLSSLIVPSSAFAAKNEITVYVEGLKVDFSDSDPILDGNRVLIPLRGVFEKIGAKVDWDNQSETIKSTLHNGNEQKKVIMKINSSYVQQISEGSSTDSTVSKIDTTAKLIENRTLIPLRAAGEAFGYEVLWDADHSTVHMEKGDSLNLKESSFLNYDYISSSLYVPNDFEFEVFFLTNKQRENYGLSPLTLNANISYVANIKSSDMLINDYFDHTSPTYGSPFEMMKSFGLNYKAAAENIAVGQSTPEQVVNGWMNSSGHRANILSNQYTEIGIGYSYGSNNDYGHHWTQQFLTP